MKAFTSYNHIYNKITKKDEGRGGGQGSQRDKLNKLQDYSCTVNDTNNNNPAIALFYIPLTTCCLTTFNNNYSEKTSKFDG